MIFMYPAQFEYDQEDGGYCVTFPDLPGCITQGDTKEEAMLRAQEAMGLYLEPDGATDPEYPHPSDIDDVEQPSAGFISYVTANVDLTKSSKYVRKNLTIPEWLNTRASSQGVNFSQVLQEALVKQCY